MKTQLRLGAQVMKKIVVTLFALSGLCMGLAGCEMSDGETQAVRETISAQAQALEEAQRQGLLQAESEQLQITLEQAKSDVEKIVTAENVSAVESAEVVSQQGNPCYVFSVQDGAQQIGQIAIDAITGDKFYYTDEGVLEDYKAFPAYNPVSEVDERWLGQYEGPLHEVVCFEPVDEDALVYSFESGRSGTALLEGEAAKSEDGELVFLLSDEGLTVVGGSQTGNYVPIQSAEAEDEQEQEQDASAQDEPAPIEEIAQPTPEEE